MNKNNYLTKKSVVAFLALICCVLWGSAIPTIKTAYGIMGVASSDAATQVLFAGVRFALAGIMVILFASIRDRKLILPDRNVIMLAPILCLAQTVGQYFFFYIGVANSSGVSGAIITGIGNFILILMSCLIFRMEKMTRKKAIGCMLGFLGIIIINIFGSSSFGGFHLIGEGFLFISQFSYAFSSILIRIFSKKASPVIISGYQFTIGGIILAIIGILMGGSLTGITVKAGILLIYLAMVSAVAYTLWSILLAHNPVSSVAIWGFINPLASVILSALILGEYKQAFNLGSLSALCCVCIGIYIVNMKE
ncbi:MAG: DMT family transporter [Eubacteriales bacterium]|nr:DMT family transporter [Eubacteriales bacterium]